MLTIMVMNFRNKSAHNQKLISWALNSSISKLNGVSSDRNFLFPLVANSVHTFTAHFVWLGVFSGTPHSINLLMSFRDLGEPYAHSVLLDGGHTWDSIPVAPFCNCFASITCKFMHLKYTVHCCKYFLINNKHRLFIYLCISCIVTILLARIIFKLSLPSYINGVLSTPFTKNIAFTLTMTIQSSCIHCS